MLFLAIGKLPYNYFIVLRFVVTLSAIFGFSRFFSDTKLDIVAYIYLAILILFNPWIPFHLSKETWQIVDILSAIILIWTLISEYKEDYVE